MIEKKDTIRSSIVATLILSAFAATAYYWIIPAPSVSIPDETAPNPIPWEIPLQPQISKRNKAFTIVSTNLAKEPEIIADEKESAPRWTLRGLVTEFNNKLMKRLVIVEKNGIFLRLKEGEEIIPGVTIQKIEPASVVIYNGVENIRVPLFPQDSI